MGPFKVLYAHDYYVQSGGEDTAFAAEVNLLRRHGHEVVEFIEDNHRIDSGNRAVIALQTLWSWESYRRLRRILRQEHPDIAHFHNIFPLISPSAYYACRAEHIPVIQSLDNPRLLCPSANFYRNGRLCQDCLGKTPPWPGVLHRCYHRSARQTSVIAAMLSLHRWAGTWNSAVDYYLVATEFYRKKFIEGGLSEEKIVVKPHFVETDPQFAPEQSLGSYALYIGRLDPEKGVRTLLSAWKQLPGIPLKIRGQGQLEGDVQDFMKMYALNTIERVGRLDQAGLFKLIKGARFLVWPSEGYYETFGYVAVESFSCGIPVIASNIGVMADIVGDQRTGLLFAPGDANDLAQKVQWAWDHPLQMVEMGENARREYELKYTAEHNYTLLMEIYQKALIHSRERWNDTSTR